MRILGTICARGGSKGIPGKNIRNLNGRPLIGYTIDCARGLFDDLIVSTDDKAIAQYARGNDCIVQMRPSRLATDTASKWDVFRHIAKENKLKPDDILVDLDTGCPLREPSDIVNCIAKLTNSDYDVVATAYLAERNPYFNMVQKFYHSENITVVCSPATGNPPITRRQDAPRVYSLSPAVFAIRVDALEEYRHWSEARLGIVVIPRRRAIDIDTEDDWQYVEYLMKGKK